MTQQAEVLSESGAAESAWKPVDVQEHTRLIFSTVRTVLIERYREELFDATAEEMFPAKEDLSEEDERAVTARMKDDLEAFKSTLDNAIHESPADEESFFDVTGAPWETMTMSAGADGAARFDVHQTPISKTWGIFSIFAYGEDAVAVYVFPTAELDSFGKRNSHARILLSRHQPSCSYRRLTPKAFRAEIVREMVAAYEARWPEGHLADDPEDEGEGTSGPGPQPS